MIRKGIDFVKIFNIGAVCSLNNNEIVPLILRYYSIFPSQVSLGKVG